MKNNINTKSDIATFLFSEISNKNIEIKYQ